MNKKFEKGKWYKLSKNKYSIDDGWYIKFKDIENNIIIASEWIYTKTNKFKTKGNFGRPDDYSYTLLTDLSEIQQYLPDGHIDKIVNFLIKDKVYRYHYGNEYVIGKCYENKSLGISFGFKAIELGGKSNEYWRNGSFSASYYQTFATQEEEDWLNACIKANKFVPKDKINVKPEETVAFILPERWCIKITKENVKIVGDYFDSQSNDRCYNDDIWEGKYFHSINKSGQNISSKGSYLASFANFSIIDGFTEITFEQFKKNVLKEEESTPIQTNFDNCKIWIGNNPELSRKVQERLFELGYDWHDQENMIQITNGTALFFDDHKIITYSSNPDKTKYFAGKEYKEIFPEDLGIKIETSILNSKVDLIDGQYYYCENTKWKSSYIFLKNGVSNIKHIDIINHHSLDSDWDFWTHKNTKNLRLATPEEKQWLNVCIVEGKFIEKDNALKFYSSDGKPLPITTTTKEPQYFPDLSEHIGRYIKALVDRPNGGEVKKGEIGKIIDKTYVDFPSQSKYACTLALAEMNKNKYELMPKDYNPNSEKKILLKEIFKVGDWVIRTHNAGGIHYKGRILQIKSIHFNQFKAVQDENDLSATHLFSSVRKATNEEIGKALIEIAKEKYPVGTKYTNLHYGTTETVEKELKYHIYDDNSTQITDGCGGAVYRDGKWATIVDAKLCSNPKLDINSEIESEFRQINFKLKANKCNSLHNPLLTFRNLDPIVDIATKYIAAIDPYPEFTNDYKQSITLKQIKPVIKKVSKF